MQKYVVVKLGGKQYLVQEGDTIKLERQPKPLKLDVLLYSEDGVIEVGESELKSVSVKASIVEEKLDKKVRVARFKKKSRYERVRGHRQPISIVRIDKISRSVAKGSIDNTEKKVKRSAPKKVITTARKVSKSSKEKK
ncbi:50S ribosomal protein L21 [candidate division WWE3 bacterium]|uniref:Large ribosomal subunit protein bL21 n=1 Tax=candidate division WWE3 bacterium TaxID=2053526 RepID=A0A7X9E761_UNCKA|nr:50S ribosomal protein L21 [candidate division WWE3 bacterium]